MFSSAQSPGHGKVLTRKQSDGEGTDEDVMVEDQHTQHLDNTQPDSAGGVRQVNHSLENDQIWGILRVIRTQKEYKLIHRTKDGLRDNYIIGRSKSSDIVVPDKRVSSHHCSVYCDYSQARLRVFVEDNSSNGTFVNGSSIKLNKKDRTELKSGDEIYVLNPDLPTDTPDFAGPFLFINMRDRYAVQKKVFQAPEQLLKRRSVGRHIEDEYIIGEQLGSGMCGQVHRCVHRKSKVQYAVKIINTRRFSLSPGLSTKELREEAEIMRNLNHPHIIRIQDAFELDHILYIVMELVTGGDLFDKIIELGRYGEDDARRVLIKVMDAVKYLHRRSIVHRDLKPENILLTEASDPTEVKITDFGLAKRTNQEGLKTFCGTPQYFAPEVLRRKAPTDAEAAGSRYGRKADVWSVGVITYIMLSGSFPFDDEHLFDQIEHAEYSLSGAEWSTVSSGAKHFIRSLMNLDIENRLDIDGALAHPWIQDYKDRHDKVDGVTYGVLSSASSVELVRPPLPHATGGHGGTSAGHSVVTPDRGDSEMASAETSSLAVEELKQLINSEVSSQSDPAKPTIFWSNKAALVKLASIKKKISVHSASSSGTPVLNRNCNINTYSTTSAVERASGALVTPEQDVALVSTASQSSSVAVDCVGPFRAGDAAPCSNTSGRAKPTSRKRKKIDGGKADSKAFSDDDIEFFSDNADDQTPTEILAVTGHIRTAKRSKFVSKRSKTMHGVTSRRQGSGVADAKNTVDLADKAKTRNTAAGHVSVIEDIKLLSVAGVPLKPLEMDSIAIKPKQTLGSRAPGRRHTMSQLKKAVPAVALGVKSIENYFSKQQRVLRVPVSSLSDVFDENSHNRSTD